MEFVSKIVERVIDVVLDLGVRHVAYIVYYGLNVDELNGRVKDLGFEKERIGHQVDEAMKNLQNIESNINEWFRKVDEVETKVHEFWSDEGHTKTQLSKTNGLFPYLRNRHRLGRQAKRMSVDVGLLIEESKFDEVSYQQNPTSNDAILSNAGYVEFGSTKSTMEDIMAKLEDSSVRMIGLYGPGGVGKSTLIKEIAKKARDKKLFNVVVIVNITANPNPQKIQEEIAYLLGLRLEGEGETVRADRLRRRLRRDKENTLVILDDLWDKLDLNKLGIPLAGDDGDNKDGDDDLSKMAKKEKSLGDYKGCKILLTSRDKKVLSDKMDVKSIFCVKGLDDKDALMLFKKVTEMSDELSKFQHEIVQKYCAGIPMAIVTVGRALRDKSESVWEATLEILKKQELVEVQKSMEISVKMSYDHLENEELKSIFLLCAQMGHQPLIMDLVKYCFGLGILEGVYSLREARDRIYTSIKKLKDASLMFDGSNHFNMHDMVRDAALSIAHKEKNVLTLRNGKLDDWPELKMCTSISICNSDIIDELPNVLNCPQLKFFQIDSDDPSLKIPECFFDGMEKLRVLILTGIHLPSLPFSIKCLSNLRMLCLERCTLDRNLSIIGELKKLRILSFSGSQIENFPVELECLDKLQLLDISNCSIVQMIPPNFISRLTCLEELYIRKSLIKMLVEGEKNQDQISLLSKLKHLHQLKVVDLCIPSAAVLPKGLFFDKLNDYKIVIGDFNMLSVGDFRMPNKYEAFRSLALQLMDGSDIHSQKGIKLLFKRVENLLLGELNGVQNVIYELNLDGFPDLKHLSITDNTSIKYLNSMDLSHPPQDVFPNLEFLCLYKLRNIEMICCSPVTDASFTKLKTIKIMMCARLKNIFSFYMAKFLASLETIDVSECDSLNQIVEIPVNSDEVEFPKLHSLKLQSLPSFTSFYTRLEVQTTNRDHIEIDIAEDKHSDMASLSLFGELVEIPNLESLTLFSINILKIWSDQPRSSFCFQNLIELDVQDCNELRYLCSLSVASRLKKLNSLLISCCGKMEKIFITEGNNAHEVCVFPTLEEIHLYEMDMLTDIWQAEVSAAHSFSRLISVHIEGCNKLDKIFPSHMEGWFASLESLTVVDCKLVEVIFEIKDSQQIDASSGIDTNLQHIKVSQLPNLKQVWSTDPGGILNFNKLRNIQVSHCEKLRNVFPASVAKDVEKLEYMSVRSCQEMVEIVACEDGSETNNEPLVFPELTYMELVNLLNIQRFYKGRHTIECPKLKKLTLCHCKKLKAFPTATTSQATNEGEKPVFSAEKIIPNLEYMYFGLNEANKWLSSNNEKYRMHRLKELTLSSVKSGKLLFQFLYRMPNLEKLKFVFSGHLFEELVQSANIASQKRLGSILQLKELILWSSEIKDLGFEQDPVLQRLELLRLGHCHKLTNLAPSSVSLTYLTYLEVKFCNGFISLMTSSTAKSLVQLKTMKVIQCDEVKEIVTKEEDEKDKVIEIVFSKLITIVLVGLKYLTSFCSYEDCRFKFPSLEKLIVSKCPMMETFSKSHTTAPKLQNILAVEGEEEEEEKWQWKGDLNATIRKDFEDKILKSARSVSNLRLRDNPLLQKIWHGSLQIPGLCFSNLRSLIVVGCQFLSDVLPLNLLPLVTKLEILEVRNCDSVRTIFDVKCVTEYRIMTTMGPALLPLHFPLKKLILEQLPNLENVWNGDPHGILTMQHLKEVNVNKCESLTSLFPTSVAKDLVKLENLVVKHCQGLMTIVAEDNADPTGTYLELMFPRVTSLTLFDLPNLKYLYYCSLQYDMLKTSTDPQPHTKDQVSIAKLTPNLLSLSLGENELKMVWCERFQENHLHKLKVLTLLSCIEFDVFPYEFLPQVPNIKKLVVRDSSLKEIFCFQSHNVDDIGLLSQLKVFHLELLPELVSIGLENSWVEPFIRNLETLQVNKCFRLRNLASSSVCFSNLLCLVVFECRGLVNLFTSSTAKSLAQLKRMEIKFCDSILEIVSKEEHESHENEIIFWQLNCLNLECLPNLVCFYTGSLSFPSLEQLSLINCHKLETLCPGTINAGKLSGVKFQKSNVMPLEIDLNSTTRKAFLASAKTPLLQ